MMHGRHINENTITDFGYDWDDIDWTSIRIGGSDIIIQNVQGFVLESTTPLLEFPRHSTLRDWLEHHSNQFDDYLWDNISVTNTDVERVVIEEPTYFNNLLNDVTTPGPELRALESKMDALFPLTPDVTDLTEWADIFNPAQASQSVEIITGYSLLADYRSDSDRYESNGVTYDATGTDVVDYTGLTDDLKRIFGFQVSAIAQVDTITLTGTSGTANINVNSTNYLATFNTNLTTTFFSSSILLMNA